MKTLLINTPRSPFNGILEHASPKSLKYIHRKLIGPPLGLLTIAAALREEGHDVHLIETKAIYDEYDVAGVSRPPPLAQLVEQALNQVQPDMVGVTFIASELNDGIDILKCVKAFNPEILTIAGGLHTTLCPEDFRHPAVDIVCPGESAKKIRAIGRAFDTGTPYAQIPGLYLNRDARLEWTGTAAPVDSAGLDYIIPDRSLVEPHLSTYVVGNAPGPSTYLFTSLGCPNRCTFCSIWPQYNGAYHQRTVESIVEELKTLTPYPVVRFADANTLVDADFLFRLFDRIKAEGIQKTFVMDMRVDAAAKNPKLIEHLAEGGLKVVISGFESYRNKDLARYNKSQDAKWIATAIDIFHKNGVMIRGNYVIPPDFDDDDFDALGTFAAGHKVAYPGFTILTPMPGTPLFNRMRAEIIDADLRKYNFFNCVVKPTLPLETFYRRTADLWAVRDGDEII